MPDFIPAGPADVTPEWVTATLRSAGALPSGRVAEVAVERIVGAGTGLMGDTVRLRLRYDGTDAAPSSVIAKFPTADRHNRALLEQFDAYAREILFYQRYAHRVPAPTPTYLGAAFDPGRSRLPGPILSRIIDRLPAWVKILISKHITLYLRPTKRRYALLIEDLGSDTTVHDLAAPPNDEQVGAALVVLARIHAAFWQSPTLDADDMFEPLVTTTPGLYRTIGKKRCLPIARERWDWITADQVGLLDEALDRLADDLVTINQRITLVHGDPRSDNILYRRDGEVVLVDWALTAHAHPGWDVGYLLSSCLSDDRINVRDELVERYEATLRSRGVEFSGSELREGIDAAYRANAVQQLMSVPVLHGTYGDQLLPDLWMPRILAGLGHGWSPAAPTR